MFIQFIQNIIIINQTAYKGMMGIIINRITVPTPNMAPVTSVQYIQPLAQRPLGSMVVQAMARFN